MFVYIIENLIDHSLYVGKSKNPEVRWKNHLKAALWREEYIYRAIRRYGSENFECWIVSAYASDEEALLAESEWIVRLRSFGLNLYNMNDGGLGGSQNLCDESRLSKSKKMKEIERSPEWIRRIADSHRGMKRSDSTKKKLSDSHIGKVHSNETKQKIREARKRYWDARRAGVILTPK